jgi:hypothetical protein
MLGWPFKEVSVSVPEEVSKTVVEIVEVPVQVTKWFFWKTTKAERQEVEKEVKETRYHTESKREFSVWLLIPMAGVGLLCYQLEKWTVQLFGHWLG